MIRWIGIPYSDLDCFDLVRQFLIVQRGLDIGDRYNQDEKIHDGTWIPINKESIEKYDLLLMTDDAKRRHVGIAIDRRRFLHTLSGMNSIICKIKHSQWYYRIRSVYRHKTLL